MTGMGKSRLIQSEIDILQRVSCNGTPNIVPLRECFEDEENVYLVMDLCTGGDLYDRIQSRETFYEEDAADVIRSVLEAIEYLHTQGVVHRDIKPENILFKSPESSETLLTDFGLSKILPAQTSSTNLVHTTCGTLRYMAPEVLESQPHTGKPSDMWSLGVMTYFWLSGTFPFGGKNDYTLFANITCGRYTFEPKDVWEGISDEAKDFISSLLVLDPQKRMTASKALHHAWIVEFASPPSPLPGLPPLPTRRESKNLVPQLESTRSKFQTAVAAVMNAGSSATTIAMGKLGSVKEDACKVM
ncbi:UNVERIFIED_CONTAM: hypothetical protein HDU68_009766 [Siphonaria sp. JEL0065]|nr:hypothetical protein HDU68_009766 [Siphonaria sp. JEL0065]